MRKKLMVTSIVLPFIIGISCTPFSRIASKTTIGNKDSYIAVSNPAARLESVTFGDFKFATNKKQYRKLCKGKKGIKDILFYAKTDTPAYEYFVLYHPRTVNFDQDKYSITEYEGAKGEQYILLISKDAPERDVQFIKENMILPLE